MIKNKHRQEKAPAAGHDWETIFNLIPAMFFYKDLDNRFLKVNRALAKAAGWSRAKMEGASVFDLFPEAAALKYWRDDKEIFRTGKPKRNILEAMPTAAGTKWVRTDKIPYVGNNGEILGIIGFSVDITKQVEAEKKLRASESNYRKLLDALQEGIWVIDRKAITSFVNPFMAGMLGYTVGEMLGQPLFAFMDREGVRLARENVQRRKKGLKEEHDFKFIHKNGVPVFTHLRTGPIYDDYGRYAGATAMVTDITQVKKAEEEKQELTRMLMAAEDRERKRIAMELHDQIGQQLTGLSLWLKAMENSGKSQSALPQAMRSTEEIIRNLNIVINNFYPPELTDYGLLVSLKTLVEKMTGNAKTRIVLKGRDFSRRLPPQIELCLYRVAQEALTNAVKHSGADKITVGIVEKPAGIGIRIQDNGHGMRPKQNESKTGHGLYNIKARLSQVNGQLNIVSQPGKGTSLEAIIKRENLR